MGQNLVSSLAWENFALDGRKQKHSQKLQQLVTRSSLRIEPVCSHQFCAEVSNPQLRPATFYSACQVRNCQENPIQKLSAQQSSNQKT